MSSWKSASVFPTAGQQQHHCMPGIVDVVVCQVEKFHSFCKSMWVHHQGQRMVGLINRWRWRFMKLGDLSWLRLILMLPAESLMELCFSDAGVLAPGDLPHNG